MFKKLIASVMLASLALTTVVPATVSAASNKDIVDRVVQLNKGTGQFDSLLAAAQCAEFDGAVVDLLKSPGHKTLFAPTDAAFDVFLAENSLTLEALCTPANAGTLLTVLGYHVIDGASVTYRDAKRAIGGSVDMFLGGSADITGKPGDVRIDGAKIIRPNKKASNGIVHVVDAVLIPAS